MSMLNSPFEVQYYLYILSFSSFFPVVAHVCGKSFVSALLAFVYIIIKCCQLMSTMGGTTPCYNLERKNNNEGWYFQ